MNWLRFTGSYLRAGLYSFNAAASEVLLEQLVEKRAYLSSEDFARLMSLSTLAPGPFHINLVIATARHIGGFPGVFWGLGAFIFPGFVLAAVAAHFLQNKAVQDFLAAHPGITIGMTASVCGLILSALTKLARTTLSWPVLVVPVVGLAALLYFFRIPFAAAVLLAGLVGGIFRR